MRTLPIYVFALAMLFSFFSDLNVSACTNLLVTRAASADGSTMITYTCDGEFHPHLSFDPAADYQPGDSLAIEEWGGDIRGYIRQVEHTYAVVDMMNEHQLAICETTFDGILELQNKEGLLHYWDLINLALQRAKTAREAITVMTDLVEEYGYRSTGESFSIADPEEVWYMEMIGPGEGGQGAVWVALKIPDGYICAHANKARIGEFPLDDPENCLYANNVISFAIDKGYYDPYAGQPFLFNEAYCPSTPKNRRYGSTRVWSLFRRAAPSLNFSPDYHRSVKGTEPYPLWIKPDRKLSIEDVFDLMRDHYEGTDYDMTVGVDAGPYGMPNRWRPLYFKVDSLENPGVEYMWERPISTQQTGFSFVSQSRSWLPDPIGGVIWYGVDDTYTTCYFPLYCGITEIPEPFTVGSLKKFSWESAWWIFNLVANYACLRYSDMVKDIQEVQSEIEGDFLKVQPVIEEVALNLHEANPDLMTEYLTGYSVSSGETVFRKWRELAGYLITKYNDGYVKDTDGHAQDKGYPEDWLREVIKARPKQFKLPEVKDTIPESRLID